VVSGRRNRIVVIGASIAIGLTLVWFGLRMNEEREAEVATPMDIEWVDGFAYASLAEGQILGLTVDGDRVEREILLDGLAYPRGLAVQGDTLFVAELGALPCENPVPRCKGEQVGATSPADGEREILATSAGRVLAVPITTDGLGEPDVLVDGLHFVNADHGLNDLDLGPDGMLYLSVGNLDRLAWDDGGDAPSGPETELLGTILRIDPDSGEIDVFASGTRNVFGLMFDGDGELWGVDNDGPGRGPWRFEELLHLQEGLDYGFPDDGSVGPYERRTGFAEWIMPVGAGSGGIVVDGTTVLSGGCGIVTEVDLVSESGDAAVLEADYSGCLTAIEPMPDGRLLLGTVFGDEAFRVMTRDQLLGR
jgi:Glucose / Sorbosone dehydrogenase